MSCMGETFLYGSLHLQDNEGPMIYGVFTGDKWPFCQLIFNV